VWGSRSTLAFTDDQTNAVVLQHELSMLDVMTGNRDERVWARASMAATRKSTTATCRSRCRSSPTWAAAARVSSAQKEGVLRYISGEEAIKHMAVKKGFEVHLFADEAQFPQLANPVQMQFDTKGRLWVAAWRTIRCGSR
jgi:hypothetical protein